MTVYLNAANTRRPFRGKNLDFLFLCYFARNESTRDDRTETLHGETAVHGKTKNVGRIFRPRLPDEFTQCFNELRNALTRIRTGTQNGRAFQKASFQKLPNLDFDEIRNVGFDFFDFCKYREPLLDMKQGADVQVLMRLRHHRFIRSDDEHHQVNAPDSGKHVLDESFMAGNVDETNRCIRIQWKMRKTDIDRDTALLFLFQAVGINSCERFY